MKRPNLPLVFSGVLALLATGPLVCQGLDGDGGHDDRLMFKPAQKGGGFPYLEEFAWLVLADFNGDKKLDAFLSCAWNRNRLFLNKKKGRFQEVDQDDLPEGEHEAVDNSVAVGDVDGDGDLDLMISHGDWDGGEPPMTLWLNKGKGEFKDVGGWGTDHKKKRIPEIQTRPITFGDVDGDGDLDLIYGRTGGRNPVGKQNGLLLNNGKGYFTEVTATHMPVALDHTFCLALGDVDGDGDLDLVVGNWRLGSNSNPALNAQQDQLYLNDGTGRFAPAPAGNFPNLATQTRGLTLFDWEGDGDLDLILARGSHYTPDTDSLYLNDGNGKFTEDATGLLPSVSRGSRTYRTADVDGDGDLDLLAPGVGQSRLLRNNGSGSFTDFPAGSLPVDPNRNRTASFGDMDRDGDVDLVMSSGNQMRVLWNDGNGKFSVPFDSWLPFKTTSSEGVALGDVDGDGDLDAVFANYPVFPDMAFHNLLYLNDGDGRFTDNTAGRLPADSDATTCVVLGDVDGDGDLDIIFGVEWGGTKLYANNGSGFFTDVTSTRMPDNMHDLTYGMELGDVDKDGDLDLVLANAPAWWGGPNRLFLNNGGTFTDATATNMPPGHTTTISRGLELGDVDGDGDLDIVVGNGFYVAGGDQNMIYLNDGNGKFTDAPAGSLPVALTETMDLTLGDVDGDGDLDLYEGTGIFLYGPTSDHLYLNDGKGKFKDVTEKRLEDIVPDVCFCVEMVDIDQDGDLDLYVSKASYYADMGAQNRLYLNDGKGKFKEATRRLPNSHEHTNWFALGDVDGDDDVDVLSATYYEPQLFLNQGDDEHHDSIFRGSMPRAEVYGHGCQGSAGIPSISASGLPTLGNRSFSVVVGQARSNSSALLFVGRLADNVAVGNGCTVYVQPLVLSFMTTVNATGQAKVTVPIPNDPSILGSEAFFQYIIDDPRHGAFLGVASLTGGLHVTVGN